MRMRINTHVLFCLINLFLHTRLHPVGLDNSNLHHEPSLSRDIIRRCTNATDLDSVLFCGSGCTAAITKFIGIIGLEKLKKKPVCNGKSINRDQLRGFTIATIELHHGI